MAGVAMLRPALLLPLALLAGCKLVDQRTFDPEAGRKPVVAALPAAPVAPPPVTGPVPLVRIPLHPPQAWQEALKGAVAAARRAKPDVVFRVVLVAAPPVAGALQPGQSVAGAVNGVSVSGAEVVGAPPLIGLGGPAPGAATKPERADEDEAARIARVIVDAGVPASRVVLEAQSDAAMASSEVRVYVR